MVVLCKVAGVVKGGDELRDRSLTVSFAGGLDRGDDEVVGEVVVSEFGEVTRKRE